MPNPYELLERRIHRFALAIALLVALAIPVGYSLVTYFDYSEALDFKAKVKASALSESVASNPDTWMFAENRMQGLLFHEPVPLEAEHVRVVDKDHTVVAQFGNLPPAPVLSRTYPLYDSGRVVGQIEVVGTMRLLLWNTLASAIIGVLFGVLVYTVMKALPLRALSTATAALRASELRFRSLFESVPNVAVQGYDADRRVICWNKASERLYGYSAAEALGQYFEQLIVPEAMRPQLTAAITAWINDGSVIPAEELVLQRKDGSAVTVFSSHTMLTNTSGQPEMYCIDVELTELKRTEAELRSYQKHLEEMVEERTMALTIAKEAAEAANRAKTTFLANMSHELRTPMNAIMGMTNIALHRTTDQRLVDPLTKVTYASQHLLGVLNDLLDISKIEAERLSLDEHEFTLGNVIDTLTSLIGHKAAEKSLSLRIDVSPDLYQLELKGDHLRLGQILLNLTGNAVRFTTEGSITVRARVTEDSPAGVVIRFEVQDTGIGILAEDQKRLFAVFEQVDGSTTRRYGGTGLGLAISKRLAQMMGGTMGLDSQLGKGSLFWFTCSFVKCSRAANQNLGKSESTIEEQLRTQYAGSRILLAEDDPFTQEVLRVLLEAAGLSVAIAENGTDAVRMVQHADYALILMDVQMPKMNGLDASRTIRALPGKQNIPILALTAHAFDEDKQSCINAGMNDHISKPVNPDTLFKILLGWLSKKNGEELSS